MDSIVNLSILREPLNWLVVWSMLLIAWIAFEAINRAMSDASDGNS